MTEPTNQSASNEAKGLPATAEQMTRPSGPNSPLSGGSDNDGSERPIREKLKKASIAGLSTHSKKYDDRVKADAVSADSSAGEEEKGQDDTMQTDTTSPLRGRPTRKRSFDDLQNESVTSFEAPAHVDARAGGHHKRMRSRDMSSSKPAAVNGKAEREPVEVLAEEEDDAEAQKSPGGAGIMVEAPLIDDDAATSGDHSPKKKRSRDQFDRDHTAAGDSSDKEENSTLLSERQALETEAVITRTCTNSDKGEPDKKRHRDASQEGREILEQERVAITV